MKQVVIKVQFSSGESHMNVAHPILSTKTYDYFYLPAGEEAKKGNYAVVRVVDTLKIVKIVGVGRYSGKANKYAICVFSLDEHEERRNKAERLVELKEALIARATEVRERERLQELAKNDEMLAGMLKELQELED